MLPIYNYIYLYPYLQYVLFLCHWCNGFSRPCRAGDADQVHAGPWNWESRDLGADRDPGTLADRLGCHPQRVLGGIPLGHHWAIYGHLPNANSGWRCMCSYVFCWKSVHCFWRKHTIWDHLGARSAKPSAWCPPDLPATHPVRAPLGLQILEVHGSPINSKHHAGGSAKRCLPFGITFHSNCAWKWSHQKAVGPPSWRWSGVYSDDTKVCLESLCLYYL